MKKENTIRVEMVRMEGDLAPFIEVDFMDKEAQEHTGFELVEDRLGGSVCGSVESIDVDYKERTLKHKFVIY